MTLFILGTRRYNSFCPKCLFPLIAHISWCHYVLLSWSAFINTEPMTRHQPKTCGRALLSVQRDTFSISAAAVWVRGTFASKCIRQSCTLSLSGDPGLKEKSGSFFIIFQPKYYLSHCLKCCGRRAWCACMAFRVMNSARLYNRTAPGVERFTYSLFPTFLYFQEPHFPSFMMVWVSFLYCKVISCYLAHCHNMELIVWNKSTGICLFVCLL